MSHFPSTRIWIQTFEGKHFDIPIQKVDCFRYFPSCSYNRNLLNTLKGYIMKSWQEIVQHNTFRYLDHTNIKLFHDKPYNALTSFAIDDALATSVSANESPPVMRLWAHPETVVLGIPDSRLPFIEEGVKFLRAKGYNVIIRNSGGLAVVLDKNVLNISLVLPDVKHISIHSCYDAMVHFVQEMLNDYHINIKAYEIVGSYCPGDYDLSINRKKFAGISQRRIKNGAAIQIYIDVAGDSYKRASIIRDFYDVSLKKEETTFTYPTVQPEVMASLSKLIGEKISVDEMKSKAIKALTNLSSQIISSPFTKNEYNVFTKRMEQMEKRNDRISLLK